MLRQINETCSLITAFLLETEDKHSRDFKSSSYRLEAETTLMELEALATQAEQKQQKERKCGQRDSNLDSKEQFTEFSVYEQLEKCLANRWERIRRTDLAYPHAPSHPVTQACLQLAKQIAPELKKSHFSILMPTLKKNESLVTSENVNELELKRFVLDDSDEGFIQISECLTSSEKEGKLYHSSKLSVEEKSIELSDSERGRVTNHSKEAKNYYTAIDAVIEAQQIKEEKHINIFPYLKTLSEELQKGGVTATNREDKVNIRPEKISYAGLKEFYYFFKTLPLSQQKKILALTASNLMTGNNFRIVLFRLLSRSSGEKEFDLPAEELEALLQHLKKERRELEEEFGEEFKRTEGSMPCIEFFSRDIGKILDENKDLKPKSIEDLEWSRAARQQELQAAMESKDYVVTASYGEEGQPQLLERLIQNEAALELIKKKYITTLPQLIYFLSSIPKELHPILLNSLKGM